MTKRIKRREGDWFVIPLAAGGHAVGLVARAPDRGATLFGYFFGPIRTEVPGSGDVAGYRPEDAVRLCRFLDHPLVSGEWPIIATTEGWDRGAWPMPEFRNRLSETLLGESRVVMYAEDDPSRYVHHRTVSAEEAARCPPEEGVFPAQALEHLVGEWLGAPRIEDEAATMVLNAIREKGLRQYLAESGGEPTASKIVEQVGGDPALTGSIAYFLLFPSNKAAGRAAKDLDKHGFTVNAEYTAEFADDGEGWLVVEKHGDLADLETEETTLSDVAARHKGQYDGWEAAT
jgi:hypothetical protein